MAQVGMKCNGCGAKYQPRQKGDHHGFRHEAGCRWEHKSNKPGRKPGGQSVKL